ncbi:MAG TPA: ATP-binding cassette domain-containing protein, partial [Phycisphaerales bacterium]|nr:ATP-binding cassette domain-containing protein [Phycisphaerales bacterium]
MSTVIEITDATKTFGRKVQALRGVSMRVDAGQVFCLLGPNGAGKSTLVKILMTVIRASSIKGTVLGRPIGHKPTLHRIGYLPEHHRFPPISLQFRRCTTTGACRACGDVNACNESARCS